jgi:hypothetical protein
MMLLYYHQYVRTTLTLDEDVIAKLREDMRRTGKSFKETVNENLRMGFANKSSMKPKRFVVRPKSLGPLPPGMSLDCASALIDELEGPLHR